MIRNTLDKNDIIIAPAKKRRQKVKSCKEILSEYINGFRMMFSNLACLYLLIGSVFRIWEINIVMGF